MMQVEELQQAASQLRDRYTSLQQHRDLLQQILGNIDSLNCRRQFV